MKTIKIFLASSNELETDRKAFEENIRRKSDIWEEERDLKLKPIKWENFSDTMAVTGLQNKYNEAIKGCDIFVMLIWTKVGKHSNKEFETAWQHFRATGKPEILTYYKETGANEVREKSLNTFIKKLEGKYHHYKTVYTNTDKLLNHFYDQLEKIYPLTKSYSDKEVTHGSKPEQIPEIVNINKTTDMNGKKTKEQINDLIGQGNLAEVFKELDKIFQTNNDTYNGLYDAYISPPRDFSMADFKTRLRAFVNRNYN